MKTLQYNIPVFVRSRHHPVIWKGKTFKYNDHFPWQEMYVPEEVVQTLFATDQIYHNPELEVQQQVGDRLVELNKEKLDSLVRLVNAVVKQRCTTDKEYQSKKIKYSKIDEKQRGLVRAWLNRNDWAMEEYLQIRDDLLKTPKEEKTED